MLSREKLHTIYFDPLPVACRGPFRVIYGPFSVFSPQGIPQYFGPLEINTDIGVLAGHSLLVTEKDNVVKKSGHYVLKKAASVGYRSTTSRLFSSVSTDESGEPATTTTTAKQTKQRWSLQLFGVKVNFVHVHCLRWLTFSTVVLSEPPTESTLRASQSIHEEWRSKIKVFLRQHRILR